MSLTGRWLAGALFLAVGAFAQTAQAQIAFVQSTGLFGTTAGITTTSTAFAAKPVVGNKIIVLVWDWTQNLTPTVAVTDSAGNTYTANAASVINQTGSFGNWFEGASVYSAPVTVTSAALTVTVKLPNNDGSSQIRAVAIEYSGVGAVDKTGTATGATATATVATAASTVAANELVVSAFGIVNPASNFTPITASAGYTIRASESQNAGDTAGAGADKIVGAVGIQSNTWTTTPAMTGWAAVIATFQSAAPAPDHFAIADAGTAVNCQASPVTITAHSSTHAAVATTATIAVSTSTGHGDWTLSSGAGSFVAGASNSGTATYTYSAADTGSVILSLKDTYAETVTINVASGSVTQSSGSAIAAEQPPLTFVASGFQFTTGANVATTIGTQIAGKTSTQSLALQAVRTDTKTGACTTVFASGQTANIQLAYQCNNPAACVAGQTFTLSNNSTAYAIAANPNGGISTYTTVPLKFSTANAEAPFTINYSDAGQITLSARYAIPLANGAASSNVMVGAGQFVVQPYTFTLSNIHCTSFGAGSCNIALGAPGNNPGATSAAGSAFIQAGADFSATVTATNYTGAATPNYGQETAPPGASLTANLVLPAGGDAAPLNNASAFGAFSGGSATGTTFNWPEVGIITLTPGVANYLGSGAVSGTTSGNVGRFIPSKLAVAQNTPLFATGCGNGAFTYVGQALLFAPLLAPVVTVTAQSAGGTTTANYTGTFMKLTNASLTGRSYTPTPASPALDLSGLPSSGSDPAIVDLLNGSVTLTFGAGSGLKFVRGSAIAPFTANISLSINVIDTDGVAAVTNPVTFGGGTGIGFNSGALQYYGRLALQNAVGSELLDLPMALTTQYYVGATQGFSTNTADTCTAAPALAFSNYQLNLSAGKTCVRDGGSPGVSGAGCAAAAASSLQYRSTPLSGNFNLNLAAPGSGNAGAVSVTATAPAWLQYTWSGGQNPVGQATFGVFPGPASRIYQREVY